MRSIIFASFVALALAATPCSDCFEPKSEYHYKLDGFILSGFPTASSELSQSRISARARFQADDRYVALQLINIRLAASHLPESQQMPALNSMEQRELSNEHRQLLELPVRAQVRNGLISEIQFEKEDAEWSKNMKRAVLNMLSSKGFYDEQDNQSFFANEKTIEGDCQVAYTIVREQKNTVITKSINFDNCTDRSETAYGLRHTSECPECEKNTEVIRPQTVYTYTWGKDSLKEVEVHSLYTINVNGQEVMKTETRSKLVLEEVHAIKNHIKKVNGEKEDIIYSSLWEQQVEDYYKNGDESEFKPFDWFTAEKKIHSVKGLIEQVQDFEDNTPETAHFLARLVRIFRTASISDLEKIHDSLYVKADKKVQAIIEHALAIAGTKNTIQHLLSHIENDEIVPLEAAQLLKSIQETPFPSQRIAESLIKFAKSTVAKRNPIILQSVWLATGSVVRGVVDLKNMRPLVREDKREIKQKFLRVFFQQFKDAETTSEKILALKTIGNAGLDISVNQLNEIIVDKRQPLPVRKEAIDALRLLKDTMPRKIQKVLLPIYKNRQHEPELRMLALWRLMNTQPEEALLVQIVSQMEKESNQQVATLTYEMIEQFAKSTNPCTQRLASDCSRVLSFTRFQPHKTVASGFSRIPFFDETTYTGAQFDFAAVFEKNSVFPKDLHASLDAVFGGNWNKHLAQIGFSQHNLDHYIIKAVARLQALQKESTNIIRARRIESGINLLKELAKKMNIRVRPTTQNENDFFAMLYLRYKDMDYAVFPLDIQALHKIIEQFASSGTIDFTAIRRLFNQDHKFESHHAAFFYEAVRKFPTSLGLPITVSGKIPSVFSAEGQFTLELEESKLRMTVDARPSLASTHIYEMRMFTPLFEQGVKSLQSIRASTPVKIEVVAGMKKNFEIVYKVIVPEDKKSLVSLTSRPVVFLRFPGFSKVQYLEAEERTVVIPQWQQMIEEVEKVENVFGLEISTRGSILNQWTLENWLLAEQDFEVSVENKDRPAEFSARITVSRFVPSDLSEIETDELLLQISQENSDSRREFTKMVKNIQKADGYKNLVTVNLEAPRDYSLDTKISTVCDEQIRMCQWDLEIRRSPMFEETKEWTLRSQITAVRPEMTSSLRQLREQEHREVRLRLTSTWGSQKKNQLTFNAMLEQSKEQKKYEHNIERQLNGIPEYELLIKAARLNQVNAVAEYKFSEETEQTIARWFNLFKTYNFWTVSTLPENNEENRVTLQLTVEPTTLQYVNVSVETPNSRVIVKNAPVSELYLPSLARHSFDYELRTGPVCKVQKNQIRTFDKVLYKTPLTTCYSLIAKDCSEEPTFAVLSKKSENNSKNLIIKVIRGEEEVVAELRNKKMSVKVNGQEVSSDAMDLFEMEQFGDSLIIIQLPVGEVRFDGYTLHTKLPISSVKNQLCGLCGNNDADEINEFNTADNTETDDIEEFHRSYLLKNDECQPEEELLSEKKNYKKYERHEEESEVDSDMDDESEPEYTDKKNKLDKKTLIKELSHRICFSMEPMNQCRRGYEAEEKLTKKVRFTCLPRHSQDARRLQKRSREEPLQLNDYPVSSVEPVKVPTACVAY